jgi:hypothetical protein
MQLTLSLFRLFPFTLHVSGPYWPIIRNVLCCYYATIWFLQYDKATSTDARKVNNTARTKW